MRLIRLPDSVINTIVLRKSRGASSRQPLRPVDAVPRRLELQATAGAQAGVRTLYRPSTARGRIARDLGLVLFRRPRTAARNHPPFPLDELLDSAALPPWDELAIRRSHRRQRWVVAVIRGSRTTAIVKVGRRDDPSLANEAAWLHAMSGAGAGAGGAVRVPKIVACAQLGSWQMVATEAAGSGSGRRPDLGEVLQVCSQLRWLNNGAGVTHGDLAPWNMLGRNPCWLVDWEHAREYEPGVDLACFVIATGAVDRWFAVQAVRLLSEGSPLLRTFATGTGHSLDEVRDGITGFAWERRHRPGRVGTTARSLLTATSG